MQILKNHPDMRNVRKVLRKNMTRPEQKLWYYLRGSGLSGYKFRRQYSVGQYVLDFYCVKAQLAIEVDGDSHSSQLQQKYDEERTKQLGWFGIRVLRFTNYEVMHIIEGVLGRIRACLGEADAHTPPSLPLKRGGNSSI